MNSKRAVRKITEILNSTPTGLRSNVCQVEHSSGDVCESPDTNHMILLFSVRAVC
jgi:hypothetical protein